MSEQAVRTSRLKPAIQPWPFLLLLMAVGLVERLINLGSGLWYDEIVTLVKYVRLPPGQLLKTCTEFNNHMGFSLAAHASVAAFGESAWALRLPAVIFGVAAIPALWWLASLVVGRREALAAAILLTVSSHHVWFSQNARGYTGLMFFGLLGTALFIQGLRRPDRRTWIAYAVVLAAGLFTHLTAAFTLAAHGLIWAFLFVRSRLGRDRVVADRHPGAASLWPLVGCLLAGALAFLLYAPLVPQLADSFHEHVGSKSTFTKVPEWTSPRWALKELIEGLGLGPVAIAAVVLVGILCCVGFVSLARREPVAVLAMVLPGPVALAIFWGLGFHIWPRYFFPLLGFALIFVVRGIEALAAVLVPRASFAAAAAAAAVLLLAAGSVAVSVPNWRLPKQDYEGARNFVMETRRPGEPVLTSGMAALSYTWLYARDWIDVADVPALDAAAAGAPRTWFVYSFATQLKASNPGVLERVQASFDVVREFPGTVREGSVVVCRTR